MNRSENITNIAGALVAAQGQLQVAVKDSTNPAFRSRYADLGAVWEAARPALQANGLSVVQMPMPCEPGHAALETVLLHQSGEYLSSVSQTRLVKDDPQGYGSAITYLRRYAMSAILGIVADDDDGNAASGQRPPVSTTRTQGQRGTTPPKETAAEVEKRQALEKGASMIGDVAAKLRAQGRGKHVEEILARHEWRTDVEAARAAYSELAALAKRSAAATPDAGAPQNPDAPRITEGQRKALMAHLNRMGWRDEDRAARLAWISSKVKRTISSTKDLTAEEAQHFLDHMSTASNTALAETRTSFLQAHN
ncbi:ERF family protein [Deinococcus pimensis]|uniref:ERF family protein n=1 Tax=Deinococcus pimensis TaxID=309888 RepID=UPI0004ACBB5B|nr:ERF family protein [Deinococcus pimensis]